MSKYAVALDRVGEVPEHDVEISVRGLTKSFGPQTVLEDITLDVPRGRITLMLGPSGTGKSVFLDEATISLACRR